MKTRVWSLISAGAIVLVAMAPGMTRAWSAPRAGVPRPTQTATAVTAVAADSLTAQFATATTLHNVLLMLASVNANDSNIIQTVTDDAGNTWSKIGDTTDATHNIDAEAWFTTNASPVTDVTISVVTPTVMAMQVIEISGIRNYASIDSDNVATGFGTDLNGGFGFANDDNNLLFAVLTGHGNKDKITPTAAGFASLPSIRGTDGAGHFATMVVGDRRTTAFTGYTYTGTVPHPEGWAGLTVTFVHK